MIIGLRGDYGKTGRLYKCISGKIFGTLFMVWKVSFNFLREIFLGL